MTNHYSNCVVVFSPLWYYLPYTHCKMYFVKRLIKWQRGI